MARLGYNKTMGVDYKLIGTRLRAQRKKCGYTQEQVAEKLDVTIGYISQIERGATKISLDLLAELSSVLSCDLAEFVTGAAAGSEEYLGRELAERVKLLDQRERRLLRDFADSLLRNRE